MTEYRVIITPRAAIDLESIYNYIAQSSPQNAAALILGILDKLENLKQFPNRTIVEHQHPKLAHPVRSLPVGPHLVYFRVLEADRIVRVLHIRHGARRRPRRFG